MGDRGREFKSGNGVSRDGPGPDQLSPEEGAGSGGGNPSTLMLLGRLTGFGWYIAVSIAGGALLGVWLDSKFDTSPALVLAGLGVGIAVAALGLVKLLRLFGEPATKKTGPDGLNKK